MGWGREAMGKGEGGERRRGRKGRGGGEGNEGVHLTHFVFRTLAALKSSYGNLNNGPTVYSYDISKHTVQQRLKYTSKTFLNLEKSTR